jgi:hypothetical protein
MGGSTWPGEQPADPRSGWRPWETWLALAAMLLMMYRPHFADAVFNHAEEGLYLGNIYALLQGKIPYRDIFMQFGPLNDYLPALVLKLAGPSIYALRAYFFWSAVLTVLMSWWLARKYLRSRPFLYIAAFVLAYEVFSPHWAIYWGGLRHFWGLVVVWTWLKYLEGARQRLWLFLAGLACAVSLLTSIEVGLFTTAASGLLLLALARHRRLSLREFLGQLGFLAGGWALGMLPLLAYFLSQGALQEYLRIAFYDVPFNHVAKFGQRRLLALGPGDNSLKSLLAWPLSANFKMFLPLGAFAAGAWLCLGAWRRQALSAWHFMVLLLLAYGLPLYLVSFRQFGGPQSQASIGPAIILGLALLDRLYAGLGAAPAGQPSGPGDLRGLRGRRGLVLAGVCLYLLAAQNMAYGDLWGFMKTKHTNYALLSGHDPNLAPLRLAGAGGVWVGKKDVQELTGVVNFLKEHTQPGEAILAVPEDGAYYFLADRPNPLRFSTPAMAYTAERFQQEILEQLQRHPVRFIVRRNKTSGHAKHAGRPDHDLAPSFYDCIEEYYQKIASSGPTLVLVHKEMKP